MHFQPAESLKSRTYVGLILAQFLAAFNDQAIHIVAIFYAGDIFVRYLGLRLGSSYVDDKDVILVVTACFIAPFFFFSTLAGMLADKYSKRRILVFWKVAEIVLMAVALLAFALPHFAETSLAASLHISPETSAFWSAALVVSVVFLMGTHSAFFVPAKYGVMPEILQPGILSSGNGFLEGTSFVAQIIGTTCGGVLYSKLKSDVILQPSGNVLAPGKEWIIGLILFALAVLGAIASFLMARIPAAAPELRLTWKLWQPLQANASMLLRSRPLALAVLGIAFFAFITLFARQILLYDGETDKELQAARREQIKAHKIASTRLAFPADDPEADMPEPRSEEILVSPDMREAQRAEMRVAFLIALIGLGIGIGSPVAGALSGHKVELGLVPIGAVFLILFTAAMALLLRWPWATRICLVLIGVAASLYIVPLYTLLQHRAPKHSKGNLVATSNFINVAGGLLAVAIFYLVTLGLEALMGLRLHRQDARESPLLKMDLPKIHFLTLSALTAGMLVLLCRKLPDFLIRSLLWLRSHGRYRLKVIGLHNLPSDGPVILATNCDRFETCMQVVTATDRFTRFVLLESEFDEKPPWLLRYLARRTGLVAIGPKQVPKENDWEKILSKAARALAQGNIVGVTAHGDRSASESRSLIEEVIKLAPAAILPVYCGALAPQKTAGERPSLIRRMLVIVGLPLPATASPEEIRQAVIVLGEWMRQIDQSGKTAATSMIPGAANASPKATARDRPAHP
jgi:acyl-[acyl-carrier-protein]-phospholipid O-acyltransferase/long-chain-fatty-acid--[acyl-carrier-protein] ligase